MTDMQKENCRLQFISHQTDSVGQLDGIKMALQGGCRWIQLRMKGLSDAEVLPTAQKAKELCREAGATFVIDDRVDLVMRVGADGVHLGKNDMPVGEARRILGDRYIIGGTANTADDVKSHYEGGADYIGCGPFRFTTTKQKLSPILGIGGYRKIVAEMKRWGISMPIVAIGGITAGDIPELMAAGVTGIAVSGAILGAASPQRMTRDMIAAVDEACPRTTATDGGRI